MFTGKCICMVTLLLLSIYPSMYMFFFIPGFGIQHWGARNLPFAECSHRPKTRKQKFIHTHIHNTTVQTILSTPGAVPLDIVSAFLLHMSRYTQAPPTGSYCTSGQPLFVLHRKYIYVHTSSIVLSYQ